MGLRWSCWKRKMKVLVKAEERGLTIHLLQSRLLPVVGKLCYFLHHRRRCYRSHEPYAPCCRKEDQREKGQSSLMSQLGFHQSGLLDLDQGTTCPLVE